MRKPTNAIAKVIEKLQSEVDSHKDGLVMLQDIITQNEASIIELEQYATWEEIPEA